MFKKIVAFLHAHPVVKTVLVTAVGGALGAAVPLVQSGAADAATVARAAEAGALAAVYGLWVKRPKDATPADKVAQ
jgi:hypothetical protein